MRPDRWQTARQVALVALLSAGFEILALGRGLDLLDEGWPLYAAMRLHAGGTLYRDVFFMYPPASLLPAWLGYAFDWPGVVATRGVHAVFTVAACVSIYFLGRRLTTPGFALLGACLLAITTPGHRLFGYIYLLFPVLALLAFARRLRSDRVGWTALASGWAGVALCFRLDPAAAVACGIGVGALAAAREVHWRPRDLVAAVLGGVAVPMAVWAILDAGAATIWSEIVVRAAHLNQAQWKPWPPLELPQSWERPAIEALFHAALFRMLPLAYLVYLLALGISWWRAFRHGRPFGHELLLAVVVWGALFHVRALGRSDATHILSVLPPACILLAHALGLLFRAATPLRSARRAWALAAGIGIFLGWGFLANSDAYLDPTWRGVHRVESLGGEIRLARRIWAERIDRATATLRREIPPRGRVLDVSGAPLLQVLSGRSGPGHLDVILPGTFLNAQEEQNFVKRLEAAPPAAVMTRLPPGLGGVVPGLNRHAPVLNRWIAEHYRLAPGQENRQYLLLLRTLAEAPEPR